MNGSCQLSSGTGCPALIGRTSSGVTITSSSEFSRVHTLLWNSLPSSGMLDNPGIFDKLLLNVLSIKPAITKLWPLSSSIVDSVFWVFRPGIEKPSIVTLVEVSITLYSGATRMRMVLRGVMTGRNFSLTPYSSYITVTAPVDAPACTTGMGNEPPERKFASCPSVVSRFGSASISARFLFSYAWMAAPRLRSLRKRRICATPERLVRLEMPLALPTLPLPLVLCMVGELPACDVVMLVCWPNALLRRAKPRSRSALMSMVANFTFKSISGPLGATATRSRFNGLPKVAAISITRLALSISRTEPRTKTVSLSNEILMSSLGKSRAICCLAASSLTGLTRTVRS